MTAVGFAIALAAAPMASAAVAEPPHSSSKQLAGPQTLCLKYSSFDLLAGERVIDVSAGIESMRVTISTPSGRLLVDESEILAEPEKPGRQVASRDDARVYAAGNHRYAFYGRPVFSRHGEAVGKAPEDDKLVVFLTVEGMDENRTAGLLDRLKLGDPASMHCSRRFLYGWEYVLGDGG